LAACGATPERSFSVVFRVPGALGVLFDYQDEDNFCLEPTVGSAATRVVARRIYLHVLPSLANAGRERLLWVGELVRTQTGTTGDAPVLQATRLATDETRAWRFGAPVHDTDNRIGDQSVRLSVARADILAAAQHTVFGRLRPAMDMNLCGDGITRLVEGWDARLTSRGYAVVAASTGVKLQTAPALLQTPISLPTGLPVEDYRCLAAKPEG
jgi:hypothetical protein